jgi:TolB protein
VVFAFFSIIFFPGLCPFLIFSAMNNHSPILNKGIHILPLLFAAILLFSCSQPDPEPLRLERIAYVSDGTIHVSGLNDGTHTKVGKGSEPSLSYDGRYLAYVNDFGNKRRIAVLDFPNRNTRIIEDVQGTSWRPVWSPTENRYLFSASAQTNGTTQRVVIVAHAREEKKYVLSREGINIYSPAWAADGETVYGHDTHFLYQWEKTGMLVSHAILKEKFGPLDFNSSAVILPSPDGSQWLIGTGREESIGRPRRHTMTLYLFDEGTQLVRKISPENLFISEFNWGGDNNSIIFSGKETRNQRNNDLYQLIVSDLLVKPLIKNATQPYFRNIEVAQADAK